MFFCLPSCTSALSVCLFVSNFFIFAILTDIHRQTDRQTDSAKVLIQAEKQTDVQKDNYLHIQYSICWVKGTWQ
jgi:hypothetical protein